MADTSTRSLLSDICDVLIDVSHNDLLSVRARILVPAGMRLSSFASCVTKNAASEASVKARVSAASVDCAILRTFVYLQAIGQELLHLSLMKITYPSWLPLLSNLL